MKYTAEQIRKEKIAFKNLKREEFYKLKEHFQKLYPKEDYNNSINFMTNYYYRFYIVNGDSIGYQSSSYVKTFYETYKASKEIEFSDFDFQEELTKLPKYWAVFNDGSQEFKEIVINYIKEKYNPPFYGDFKVYYGVNKDDFKVIKASLSKDNFHKESVLLTIEEFKNLTQKTMEKKIIGYKLKEEFKKYEEQAAAIVYENKTTRLEGNYGNGARFTEKSIAVQRLEKAGLLDIWFEKVYEEEKKEEIVSMNGKFDLKVTKEGIFHGNNEDITDYVKSVVDWIKSIPVKFGKYDFFINANKLEFIKTGCVLGVSTPDQWENVWNVYQKLKS